MSLKIIITEANEHIKRVIKLIDLPSAIKNPKLIPAKNKSKHNNIN